MISTKEKAEKLVNNMLESLYDNGSLSFKRILYDKAKQCAKIAVEEIIKALHDADTAYDLLPSIGYWNKVLKEIDKL